jgi:hypothetical protein
MAWQHILDSDWIATHQEEIRGWSPIVLLWAIHHQLLGSSTTAWQAMAQAIGFTGQQQEEAFAVLLHRRQQIKNVVDRIEVTYRRYRFSHLAHNAPLQSEEALRAASGAVKELYRILKENIAHSIETGLRLVNGIQGFTSETQKHMFEAIVSENNHLLAILSLIEVWIGIRN